MMIKMDCVYAAVHITSQLVYSHIFLTQGHIIAYLVHTTIHYCTLLVHSNHFTLLKPIYITTLLYIQANLHLHHYILHILFIHTTVNMYIPHHKICKNSSTMTQTAATRDCCLLRQPDQNPCNSEIPSRWNLETNQIQPKTTRIQTI